jgi:hypothetical protein
MSRSPLHKHINIGLGLNILCLTCISKHRSETFDYKYSLIINRGSRSVRRDSVGTVIALIRAAQFRERFGGGIWGICSSRSSRAFAAPTTVPPRIPVSSV